MINNGVRRQAVAHLEENRAGPGADRPDRDKGRSESPGEQAGLCLRASEDFNAALNVNNRDADSWAWRGVAYERMGNRQMAQESFQRALAITERSYGKDHPDLAARLFAQSRGWTT